MTAIVTASRVPPPPGLPPWEAGGGKIRAVNAEAAHAWNGPGGASGAPARTGGSGPGPARNWGIRPGPGPPGTDRNGRGVCRAWLRRPLWGGGTARGFGAVLRSASAAAGGHGAFATRPSRMPTAVAQPSMNSAAHRERVGPSSFSTAPQDAEESSPPEPAPSPQGAAAGRPRRCGWRDGRGGGSVVGSAPAPAAGTGSAPAAGEGGGAVMTVWRRGGAAARRR